jgi:hypothetical protein
MLKPAALAGFVALLVGAFDVCAQRQAIAPEGSEEGLWTSLSLLGPFLLLALLVCVGAIFFLPFRGTRRFAARAVSAGVAALAVLAVCGNIGGRVRMRGFEQLAVRSAPLIEAIERFEREQGHPPTALASLVPQYLSGIPGTGMAAYPAYDYFSGERASDIYGDRWALSVFTPSGGINFDQFYFIPSRNYPESGLGGVIERVKDWAYVHE